DQFSCQAPEGRNHPIVKLIGPFLCETLCALWLDSEVLKMSIQLIGERFPTGVDVSAQNDDLHFVIQSGLWRDGALFLRDEMQFDYPADLTAWDDGEKIVLWLRLWSMERKATAIVQTELPREEPCI